MNSYIICKSCKWVAFEVSLEYAKCEVASFNEYFSRLSLKQRKEFYNNKKASLGFYKKCMSCQGSYKNFREALEIEIPNGSTINPILNRGE